MSNGGEESNLIKRTFDMVLVIFQELPHLHARLEKHEAELKFAHHRIEDIEHRIERHW